MFSYSRCLRGAILTLAVSNPVAVFACASCGCSLSSDWDSQGFSSHSGVKLDLRYDQIDQDQYRSGTQTTRYTSANGQENELYTHNRYYTATVDYAFNRVWGVAVQIPYIYRTHATNGTPDDNGHVGSTSDENLHAFGDVRVLGRYQGLTDAGNLGLQFGLKLPTGGHATTFSSGPAQGQLVDPGLQPGSGTTDVLLGAYYFAPLSQNWDYFVQGLLQVPLNTVADYHPGTSENLTAGLRWMGWQQWIPQLQINARHISKDAIQATDASGNAEDATTVDNNSGGILVYLSPGVSVPLTHQFSVYGFVQLPIYQNLFGYQLAPHYTASLGLHLAF